MTVAALIRDAWAAQYDDPSQISLLAAQILAVAPPGSVHEAWGHIHAAWGLSFVRKSAQAKCEVAAAQALFTALNHAPGLATCREFRVRELSAEGNEQDALKLLALNAQVPTGERGIWEQLGGHLARYALCERFSHSDEALRVLYRALAVARETGHEGAVANTLGMLGAKNADLHNLDAALSCCAEAVRLSQSMKPSQTWMIAALNLLVVHAELGNAMAARALADELLPFDDTIFPLAREQSNILYARAFLLTGDEAAAQAALDRSRSIGHQHHAEWTAAQAEVWLRADPAAVRRLCEQWIADKNPEQRFITPSDTLRIHRSCSKACEALGDWHAALLHERTATEYYELQMGRAARARRITLEVEHDLERERWARETAERLHVDSERERARLDELNHQLDAALQTRTRFLAAASHDLRQPAHALALYATALEAETSPVALRALARRMRATVSSLSGMFDGLIDLARVDAGAVEVRAERVNVDELLSRLCTEYSDRLAAPASRLALHSARSALHVITDPVLLERVLRNLISNAVKYAGDGNILVALRWRASGWAIEVRDHGPGIGAADQRRVFDEFFQAADHGDCREGLGLGLAIVERFSRLLGMATTLQSQPGRGSTFRVNVPAALVAGGETVSAMNSSVVDGSPVPRGRALHVIVIDDNADARTSLAMVLKQWGHSASCAEDALAAIIDCKQRGLTPDAIISDFQLQAGKLGVNEIVHLRNAFGATLPALIVSGAHDAATRAAADAVDAAYLTKPVRPLRLKSWLGAVGPRS